MTRWRRRTTPPRVRVIEEIDGIDRLEPLDAYQSQLVDLVRARLAAGVDALDVTGAVADANDSLTRRLLGLAESHLGPPPCRYVWLALGSHGRGEQVLSSDQDSAIAYGDLAARRGRGRRVLRRPRGAGGRRAGPGRDPAVRRRLHGHGLAPPARRVRELVPRLGRPAASRRRCSRPRSSSTSGLPRRTARPDALDRILVAGGQRGPFRAQMARAAVTFRPPISLFGRLRIRRLHPGRQTRRDGGDRPAGPALCARRRARPSTAPCCGYRPPRPPAH